jgi:hypothetical protein
MIGHDEQRCLHRRVTMLVRTRELIDELALLVVRLTSGCGYR